MIECVFVLGVLCASSRSVAEYTSPPPLVAFRRRRSSSDVCELAEDAPGAARTPSGANETSTQGTSAHPGQRLTVSDSAVKSHFPDIGMTGVNYVTPTTDTVTSRNRAVLDGVAFASRNFFGVASKYWCIIENGILTTTFLKLIKGAEPSPAFNRKNAALQDVRVRYEYLT